MRGLLPALLLALTTSCLEDDGPPDPNDPDYCPTVEVVLTPVKLVRQGDICVVPGSSNGNPSGGINDCPGSLTRCGDTCADLDFSRFDCGSCGHECATSEFCSDGVCE